MPVKNQVSKLELDGWRDMPFSEAVQVNPPIRLERGEIYPFVDMASVRPDVRNAYSPEQREYRGGGSRFQSGDTLMARITPCLENGKVARYVVQGPELEAHGSTEFIVMRGRPDITDNDFAYYLTRWNTVRDYAIGQMTGTSGRQRVPTDSLDHLIISIPPLPEQRAIAHILGTLDDKIELNRRMNETLEEMARALFKSWFVDFDPVRAKMEGRWRRGETLPGMPAELFDLFPDGMVASELGEIPEGWEVRPFGTLLDDVIGGDWGKEAPNGVHTEPVSIIRGTDLPSLSNGGTGSVPLRYTTKKKAERRRLKSGDIVIEVSGGSPTQPTGRSMIITQDVLERFQGTVLCASFCRRFRPHGWREALIASLHLDFVYSIGKMWYYQLQSTGIANFQTKQFLQEENITWPGDHLVDRFTEIIEPIFLLRARNDNITLAAQRDLLLPRLISGKLQVTQRRKRQHD